MQDEESVSDWEAQPFDAVRSKICETVCRLDETIGRPPFPNPSTMQCRLLAESLVQMLRHVQNHGRIAALAESPEVNMTLPILCASVTNGSEGRKPCPVLMELLLEALICVHSVSLYPLQTTLKDAREVLPNSPVAFKLFIVTGAIDVDVMRFFLGMESPPKAERKEEKSSKGSRRAAGFKTNLQTNMNKNFNEGFNVVSTDMLNAALDTVLPSDCMEVLLSLLNSSAKFQKVIGGDSELAARVMGVYGDQLLPNLRPSAFFYCLDVPVLDTFVDVVQIHGESMALLTDSVLTHIPLADWSAERLSGLIRYCVDRKVRRDEALASLAVYVFICKLLAMWRETHKVALLPIEEEAEMWASVLNTVHMLPLNAGAILTNEEEQLLSSFSVLAECVKRWYTLTDVRSATSAVPHDSVRSALEMLTTSLTAKGAAMSDASAGRGGGGGKKKKKGGRPNNAAVAAANNNKLSALPAQAASMDIFCRGIADFFSFLFWFTPPSTVKMDAYETESILESLAALLLRLAEEGADKIPHAGTWESYLNLLLSIISPWEEKSHVSCLRPKTMSAVLSAVCVTRRIQCCGIIAQRMPDVYIPPRCSLNNYKALLEAWLRGGLCVDDFYAPAVPFSSTESIGIILSLLDGDRRCELAQLLLGAERLTRALIPALKEVLPEEPLSHPVEATETKTSLPAAAAARRGLLELQNELLGGAEMRRKKVAVQRQKEEDAKTMQLLAEVQRKEEVKARTKAFENEQQKRWEMKDEEQKRIRRLREEHKREKEERREKERRDRQERCQKAIAMLKEMAAKTKAERLAEQRERLLRYRECVAMDSRILTFLERLHLTPSRIMQLLRTLRPHLPRMTYDDVLEFVVTGNRKVPSDMHAVDENTNNTNTGDYAHAGEVTGEVKEQAVCFVDEGPSFWDSVMQRVAQQSDDQTRKNRVGGAEKEAYERNLPNEALGSSFHLRMSAVLDLFDYSMGTNETVPNPLPSLNVRCALRIIEKEALAGSGVCGVREAFLSCQQRGLCLLQNNTCTLTPLGFRYHYPFHDPEKMLEIQLERRREKARAMMAERQCADSDVEEDEEEEQEDMLMEDGTDDETKPSLADGNTVCFTDEVI
ncbi:hypothetical protein MOQ_001982 [Trypanosoma cruzi marinkellei]|uniref:Uncharacterized protein n=1 Tax=Trypanosoma cruzi marinkellei TaxID=85056 RepID=K2MR67_TRYCR|nr:hypothetical protein MOQ_001982 [Trypanosoma cruzi marinkellei]